MLQVCEIHTFLLVVKQEAVTQHSAQVWSPLINVLVTKRVCECQSDLPRCRSSQWAGPVVMLKAPG